jgi:PEP-CTERM motif
MAQFVLVFEPRNTLVRTLKARIWLTIATMLAALLWAAPASADLVYTLDQSAAFSGTNFGTVRLHQVNSTTVKVTVTLTSGEFFAGTGAGYALTWDITGDPHITITGDPAPAAMQTGFTAEPFVAGETYKASPFGNFNYAVDCSACQGGKTTNPAGPLVFDVSLASGLLISSFTKNTDGFVFAVDIFKSTLCSGACTGVVGTNGISVRTVPEPATLLIFGVGLGGIGAWRRRRKLAKAA